MKHFRKVLAALLILGGLAYAWWWHQSLTDYDSLVINSCYGSPFHTPSDIERMCPRLHATLDLLDMNIFRFGSFREAVMFHDDLQTRLRNHVRIGYILSVVGFGLLLWVGSDGRRLAGLSRVVSLLAFGIAVVGLSLVVIDLHYFTNLAEWAPYPDVYSGTEYGSYRLDDRIELIEYEDGVPYYADERTVVVQVRDKGQIQIGMAQYSLRQFAHVLGNTARVCGDETWRVNIWLDGRCPSNKIDQLLYTCHAMGATEVYAVGRTEEGKDIARKSEFRWADGMPEEYAFDVDLIKAKTIYRVDKPSTEPESQEDVSDDW